MEQKIQQFTTPPPNYEPPIHATHGFSHCPSPAQIAAYLVIATSIAIYSTSIYSLHANNILLAIYIVFGSIMVGSAALATMINPTDKVVYYYKWSLHDKTISFIPDNDIFLFCLNCDSYCMANSKHCRVCNRCVSHFDHHCMWFNNCVGDKNYKLFFISIISTFSYAVTLIVHTAIASFNVDYGNQPQLLRIVLSWIIAAAMTVFAFLLFNLIILHIYLLATKQTTFQFLQRKKKEAEEQKNLQEAKKAIKQNDEAKNTAAITQLIIPQQPKEKQTDFHSQQSMANTKMIIVKEQSHMDRTRRKQSRKSMLSNGLQQVQMKTKAREGEDPAKQASQHNEQIICLGMDSHRQLPSFLRKNKSLNFLLSKSDAQTPINKEITLGQSQEHILG